jgi:hypothetical protein
MTGSLNLRNLRTDKEALGSSSIATEDEMHKDG